MGTIEEKLAALVERQIQQQQATDHFGLMFVYDDRDDLKSDYSCSGRAPGRVARANRQDGHSYATYATASRLGRCDH